MRDVSPQFVVLCFLLVDSSPDGFLPPNHLLLHKGPTWDQPFGTISSSLICPKVDLHDIERPISSPQSGGLEAHKTGTTQMWSKDEKEAEQGSAAQPSWKGLDLRSLQCILPIRQGGKVYICDRRRVYI